MRVGLVVDATCDLPSSFIADHSVEVMPILLRLGEHTITDRRDDALTLRFYREAADRRQEGYAESIPYTAEQIERLFLDRLVLDYDHVFCLTVTSARSLIYDNAMKASYGVINKYREVRRAAELPPRFAMAVINSRNVFSGTAVLAAEVVRQVRLGAPPSAIDARIRELVPCTHSYLVPPDLFHIFKRASKKGDKSVSWGAYQMGSMLDVKPVLHAHLDETAPVAKIRHFEPAVRKMLAVVEAQIRRGLEAPHVCLSYGGPVEQIDALPGVAELEKTAQAHDVVVHKAVMSATGGVNVGPGCIAAAFAARDHHFE